MRSFCNFCNLKKVVHSLLRKVVLKKYLVNFSKASIVEFSYNIVNARCWGDWPTTLPIGDFAKNIFRGVSWILSQCHFCNTYEYLILILTSFPANIYLVKPNNRNTRKWCGTYSKSTIRTSESPHWLFIGQ